MQESNEGLITTEAIEQNPKLAEIKGITEIAIWYNSNIYHSPIGTNDICSHANLIAKYVPEKDWNQAVCGFIDYVGYFLDQHGEPFCKT